MLAGFGVEAAPGTIRGVVLSENDVRIVLVRPRNPLNIGAAARAMSNFGMEDLVLVAPHEPVWEESRSAPGAGELLRRARLTPNLAAAVADRTLVLGTSSLARRKPTLSILSLDQLSGWLGKRRPKDRIALLFGSEKTGLSNKDLNYCQWIVQIPTTADCPSMNLGQAVAVCCYELRRGLSREAKAAAETFPSASVEEVTRLASEIERLLRGEVQSSLGSESARQVRLREMLLRWPVTREDVTLTLGILRDLRWKLQQIH